MNVVAAAERCGNASDPGVIDCDRVDGVPRLGAMHVEILIHAMSVLSMPLVDNRDSAGDDAHDDRDPR